MKRHLYAVFSLIVILGAVIACLPATETVTPVVVPTPTQVPVQESPGPEIVTGSVAYTNVFFTAGVAEPVIILEDQGGFVTRDRKFLIPVESQVLGQITSDFYTSPFTYSLALPSVPNGTLHDVDHDGKDETGVMVFAVAYWTNTWGDPYLEKRDQGGGGWSSAYASTKVSDDRANYLEVYGGKYLVYAPDDQQQFPSGFGEDKKLFTDDDPIMDLPAGWSVVDLDQTPFALDRSQEPTIDLLEPESLSLDDFSDLSYTEAFDKMLEKFTKEYAWTELKNIDWEARGREFRPRFEDAEKSGDKHDFALALRDFLWSIPDVHIGFDQSLLSEDFNAETAGGVGFAMRETDDGRFIANYILKDGPAEKEGMTWGAEIVSLDGKPTSEVVGDAVPWSSPFSNPISKRLQQLRYALRFKLEKGSVEVKFKNPGGTEKTVSLEVVPERDSFNFSSFRTGRSDTALPVEFSVLPSGYGYLKISSFLDNDVLSIQVWERSLKYFNENEIPGVIIDMRHNDGGSGWLADQMAAYFFEEEIVVGNGAVYDESTGEFYMDPGNETSMIPPRPELRYAGPVIVMVGPDCTSACEFFSYNMTVKDRATIVGQYPTEGGGGGVEAFIMPEDTYVQLTISREVDADGNVHLEGKGVVPNVRVPVTPEMLQKEANGEDVILEAALKIISQPQGAGIVPGKPPRLMSQDETNSALSAMKQLEEKARETYADSDYLDVNKTFTFTIPLIKSQDLLWAWGWCAKDAATLKDNLGKMDVEFSLNGEDVPADQFLKLDYPNAGQQCTAYLLGVTDWTAGEHHLVTTLTFKSKLNDGKYDFAPGTQTFNYNVYVKP